MNPGRHRVLAAPHRHLRIPVHPRSEGQRGVERLSGQRPQQLPLNLPVVPDTHRAVADAPPVVGVIAGLDQRIQLINRADRGHRDAMRAAEPAALAFHTALLVATLVPGLAVERVKAIVRPERHPPVGLGPAAAEQHPRRRRLEVVIADLLQRHTAEPFERVHVGLQERFLALRQRRPVDSPARVRQPHREQRRLDLDPGQDHPQVMEVHLGLRRRRVGLRHETRLQKLPRLDSDLRTAFRHVVTHRRVRQIRRPVFIYQPGQHPPGGIAAIARHVTEEEIHRPAVVQPDLDAEPL